jgi:cell fate (sporulation/competence/biofilm development) regulator YlbF (YheA/YmcA/DUF963 family)
MPTQTEENAVMEKTKELCQSILNQPEVRSLRQKIDVFMADNNARGQYETLMEKGQMLHEKQHSGQPLDQREVADFEKLRDSFLKNPVASAFLDAQEELQKMQKSITQLVSKTFELGRIPEAEDLESGSCGHGCGCHH